jgi:light-regulated signal transduction histidine kinase (bacteriophytochrome)
LSELQSELREVSDRWQLATNTLNSIIYDWDIARRTVDRTQGLFDVLGYRPEEVLLTLDWWTSRIHPDDKERVITDGGIGIPEDYLPQLFESFQRASNVGAIQGTGLGLAIVKKAVDLHKGTIAVESEAGVGTTFTVTLPLKTSP